MALSLQTSSSSCLYSRSTAFHSSLRCLSFSLSRVIHTYIYYYLIFYIAVKILGLIGYTFVFWQLCDQGFCGFEATISKFVYFTRFLAFFWILYDGSPSLFIGYECVFLCVFLIMCSFLRDFKT